MTLWMRLVGATANSWLADRIGRKAPLKISIAWYSVCNFLAGLAPSFFLLFLFRALLGIGMGAELACRRRAGDGDLAGPLAALHGRGDAGLVGNREMPTPLFSIFKLGPADPTLNPHRRPSSHRCPAGSFFGGFPTPAPQPDR